MFEVYFLFGLAFIWLVFATVQDVRTKEIYNWVSFSLIVFALGFRFFYSLFVLGNFNFFYWGVLGTIFFFFLSTLFYKARLFAGGDKKLMFSLGAILPIYPVFFQNLNLVLFFILFFLFVGSTYGLLFSFYFGLKNFNSFKKEIKNQFSEKKRIIFLSTIISILFLIFAFYITEFFYLAILLFIFPYLYLFFVSVDEGCMVKKVSPKKLTEGDWLFRDVRVGKKVVRSTWDGLSKKDISLLRNKKFVLIRNGLQFAPVFLVSFVLLFLEIKFHFFFNFLFS